MKTVVIIVIIKYKNMAKLRSSKRSDMQHTVRIEITTIGLLAWLCNYYTMLETFVLV